MASEGKGQKKERRKRQVPGESKRDRFIRIAEARTDAAVQKVRILGNLANPRHYDFSREDIAKIFKALEDEVARSRAKFETSLETTEKFSLKDHPPGNPE